MFSNRNLSTVDRPSPPKRSLIVRRFGSAAIAAGLLVFLLSACAVPERLLAVPRAMTTQAKTSTAAVSGPTNQRFWVNRDPAPLAAEGLASLDRERDYLAQTGHSGLLPTAYFLAVSGGSDNGAFGAGLLNGWTAAGGRPEFKIVTGISTGALIAPLAFLGPEYDDELKEAFTTISKKDIYEERGFLAALFDDGLVDSHPLFNLVSRYVTPELLARVGEEYAKGRLLLVGTANLDARESVIWNMTAIAASGDPGALDLFRKVLLASASVPGVFPPVMFDVDVNGTKYQEMHVDGGTMAQVFLYPPYLSVADLAERYDAERERVLFVIRNASFKPDWTTVERKTLDVAERAVGALISQQGMGDLYRIYLIAQRDQIDYNLAFIGPEFDAPHPDEFDTAYMQQLYEYGYRLAKGGYPWLKYPPTFTPSSDSAKP
jgi:predicted acylesterase/phospholipase RssA